MDLIANALGLGGRGRAESRQQNQLSSEEAKVQEMLNTCATGFSTQKAAIQAKLQQEMANPQDEDPDVLILRSIQRYFMDWLAISCDVDSAKFDRKVVTNGTKAALHARLLKLMSDYETQLISSKKEEKEKKKLEEKEKKAKKGSDTTSLPSLSPTAETGNTSISQGSRINRFLSVFQGWMNDTQAEIDRLQDAPIPVPVVPSNTGAGDRSAPATGAVSPAAQEVVRPTPKPERPPVRRARFPPDSSSPSSGSPKPPSKWRTLSHIFSWQEKKFNDLQILIFSF